MKSVEPILQVKNRKCICCQSDVYFVVFENHLRFSFCSPFHQRILICCNCGLATLDLNETYSKDNILNYYQNTTRTPIDIHHLTDEDPRVVNAKKRIEFIQNTTKGDNILEIGFGDGVTLQEARRAGYEVTGIDVSRGYKDNSHYFEKQGIKIIHDDFNAFPFKARFQIVTAFLVFEHLVDPNEFLYRVAKVICPSGYLILEVPNVENYHRFYSESMLTHEHIYHYTIETLEILLKRAGYRLVKYLSRGTGYGFSLTACFQFTDGLITSDHPRKITGSNVLQMFLNYFSKLKVFKSELNVYLDDLRKQNRRCYIFGAGHFFEFLFKISDGSIRDITIALIDETPEKIGKEFNGIPIIGLQSLDTTEKIDVLLATEAFADLVETKILSRSPNARVFKIYEDVVRKMNSKYGIQDRH